MAELQNRALKGTGSESGFHQLTRADLIALAGGKFTGSLIRRLRSAELSKNVLLLEAVRREAVRSGSDEIIAIIDSARVALQAAQVSKPRAVAQLLLLPNFGLWAVECLMRLRARTKQPDAADIGHLAAFAAVAALRTRQHCRLRLPVRDGIVHLPTLGRVTVPSGSGLGWADFVSDGHGATVASGSWELRLPPETPAARGWAPAYSVAARSNGLEIRLSLEDSDPFLARLAPSPCPISPGLAQEWQQRLTETWELLTHYHKDVALGLAGALTAVVPSSELKRGQPVTATSGWAWGAVLLSLPPDKLSFAEALTHEFHHLVLAAVEDITTLIGSAHDDLCYAPWRDDPRPRSALLQGSYAFFGVAGFWLRQGHAGSCADKQKAQIEFARRSENVSDALAELRDWNGLTAAGHLFVAQMADQLTGLLAEPVDPSARATARQTNSEHRARWLRANDGTDADSSMVPAAKP
jgi:HEXXH motif-containing protein